MKRFRRLRTSEPMRRLVRETKIAAEEMIYPIFVIEGENIKNPIDSMPGIYQYSLDRMDGILKETAESGVSGILIFGIPAHKDEYGSQAYAPDGITQRAVRQIKRDYPNLLVIADVCLCEYTSHGHCGLVEEGKILNDETLPLLAKMSVSLAEAGADIIAPSDMMDGRVAAIRQALDENGFPDVPIMAYSAKFASAYYGPFREAAHSAPCFGDRRSYQMDYHNRKEALKEVFSDIEEGADIIMIKPALSYLDIIRETSDAIDLPVAAYSVSGEYAMIKAGGKLGYIDQDSLICETAASIYRAGCNILLTYFAKELAGFMDEGRIG